MKQTPLPIIAKIAYSVTHITDRLTGDRVDYPLFVASACAAALKHFSIQSEIYYGPAAWLEVNENHEVSWTGHWNSDVHFWVRTEFDETIDLNVGVSYRKRRVSGQPKALFSPPLLWSVQIPIFYCYRPEGLAEAELSSETDRIKFERVVDELKLAFQSQPVEEKSDASDLVFPNEPILIPDRRVLDDQNQSFKHFERAISVHGVPKPPL